MSRVSSIAAVAAATALVAAIPASAAAPPKGVGTVLQASGLQGITIGMPVSDATELLGKPASKKTQKVAYGTVTVYAYPKYGLQIAASKDAPDDITAVTVTTKTYSVGGNGLKVGATTAAVKKAYPKATCTAKLCTDKEGAANELTFDLKAGKVTAISAVSSL